MSKWGYTVKPEDAGYSLKELLRRNFTFSSRMMTRFKQNGCILLNGAPVRMNHVPCPGDAVSISLPGERSSFAPEDVPVIPLFEDEDLLVVNKPAGYVVHPTKGQPAHTMANGIAKYIADTGQAFKIRFVNRLDMDTSGILVIAKNAHCQKELISQMSENKVVKKYVAVVHGTVLDDSGVIDAPIGLLNPDENRRTVMSSGRPSVTRYSVLERFAKGYTLVELRLETGRTHQIRVHMSHIGHPVVGDFLYGGENVLLIERQALHACCISFCHPATGSIVEVTAGLPADIEKLIRKVR
ncbi:MAG: RluA family pseudouridine synthase [Clostridiales bacterium]|nr:RluA family pseudouridine synthase [Clostridiales bacterium]